MTEKSIYKAVEKSGVPHAGWTARKEYHQDTPIVHLYIESTNGYRADEISKVVHGRLRDEDSGYCELENMLGVYPLQVTLLPKGAFSRYMETKRKQGADLAHLKPPRMKPKDEVVKLLVQSG